ncbi:hypothetical protein OHR68_12025 [Spirillospora sp. NBC_00431]
MIRLSSAKADTANGSPWSAVQASVYGIVVPRDSPAGPSESVTLATMAAPSGSASPRR